MKETTLKEKVDAFYKKYEWCEILHLYFDRETGERRPALLPLFD